MAKEVLEDFNAAVNKLAGTKFELVFSGTLDVRIIEGNFGETVIGKFQDAIKTWMDEKIATAVNSLVKENGLAQAPKPINRGAQPK